MGSNQCQNVFNTKLNILELYSGIGGFHYAIKKLPLNSYSLTAIDINCSANRVYNYNHFNCRSLEKNIESIDEQLFDQWNVHLLTMSPPCQPFTRLGLKKDINDCRSNSFIHLMNIFPKLKSYPKYIIVENVKGFECSETRNVLIKTMISCDYCYKEFLLSPNQLNVPNSRLRYYMIAKRGQTGLKSHLQMKDELDTNVPQIKAEQFCSFCVQNLFQSNYCELNSINEYIEDLDENEIKPYLIPDNILIKYHKIIDIVKSDSLKTNCFTKGYSHHMEGSGSVLQCSDEDINHIYSEVENANSDEEKLSLLKRLKLRYFTPKEIANIMCFPSHFSFPEDMTLKQKYRLLGNSVNVKVIEFLLKLLLSDCYLRHRTIDPKCITK